MALPWPGQLIHPAAPPPCPLFRPALIQLHHYAWWHAVGDGIEDGGLFYYPAGEAQLGVFSHVSAGVQVVGECLLLGACRWCCSAVRSCLPPRPPPPSSTSLPSLLTHPHPRSPTPRPVVCRCYDSAMTCPKHLLTACSTAP